MWRVRWFCLLSSSPPAAPFISSLFFLSGHRRRHVSSGERTWAAPSVHLERAESAVGRVPQAPLEAALSPDTCSISRLTAMNGGVQEQIRWQAIARLTSRGHVTSDVGAPNDRAWQGTTVSLCGGPRAGVEGLRKYLCGTRGRSETLHLAVVELGAARQAERAGRRGGRG